jgi:cytochrome c biogenesis protein CcmG, thiol:disulfide interchange protein DsbE
MAMKKCPVCGVSVKAENLERHVKNQHPKEKVDLRETLTDEDREAIKEGRSASRPGLTSGGRRTIAIVAVIVAVLLIALVAYEYLAPPGVQPGNGAPLFTLASTDGTSVSLASYKGSPVLIEFMDVDCYYCQQEAPVLSSLYPTYHAKGVQFVSVDINIEPPTDTPTRIDSFRTNYNTMWPYCIDTGGSVQSAYGVTSTPTIFIVDKAGLIYKEMKGTAEASQANLIAALNAVSGG